MLGLPYQGCRNPNIYQMVAKKYNNNNKNKLKMVLPVSDQMDLC